MDKIRSLSEAGRDLRVDRQTVADLVDRWGIPVVPHPNNGNAKGLDVDAFERLRTRLDLPAAELANVG